MRNKQIIIALGFALVATACARRPHTRSDYGVQNHAFFDRQAQGASRGSAQGLDSEEAAGIHQHYRETLGGRGAAARNDPRSSVLILGEGSNDPTKRP